jgi:hypothetical protein
MSAYTPGPWDRAHGQLVVSKSGPICDCMTGREADAKLIAAAPELAAACKAALHLAWEVGTETEDGVHTLLDDSRGDLYRQLSDALVKAGLL